MHLILHIGMHKTGTSAIQALLRAHPEDLLAQHTLYPTTGQVHDGAHHGLWEALSSPEQTEVFASALMSEVDAAPAPVETVILSSELLEKMANDAQRNPNLETFLAGFDSVRVIYFMRNQAELIQSVFKQWVKDDAVRVSAGPKQFVNRHGGQLFYSKFASWWGNLSDHVTISAGHYDGSWENLWKQFASMSGVELDHTKSSRLYNTSLDGERLKIKHWLNANVPPDMIDFPINAWLIRNFSNEPKTTVFASETDLQEFQDVYREDNRKVAEIWNVEGLDTPRVQGAPFQTASPALMERFFDALRSDPATSNSVLLKLAP